MTFPITFSAAEKDRHKGAVVWQIRQCIREADWYRNKDFSPVRYKAEVRSWALELRENGFDHVLVKHVNGASAYNWRRTTSTGGWVDDIMGPFVEECHNAGLMVWGWSYVYKTISPIAQARAAADRTRAFGMDGYVADLEGDVKGVGNTWMRSFCHTLTMGDTTSEGLGINFLRGLSLIHI